MTFSPGLCTVLLSLEMKAHEFCWPLPLLPLIAADLMPGMRWAHFLTHDLPQCCHLSPDHRSINSSQLSSHSSHTPFIAAVAGHLQATEVPSVTFSIAQRIIYILWQILRLDHKWQRGSSGGRRPIIVPRLRGPGVVRARCSQPSPVISSHCLMSGLQNSQEISVGDRNQS